MGPHLATTAIAPPAIPHSHPRRHEWRARSLTMGSSCAKSNDEAPPNATAGPIPTAAHNAASTRGSISQKAVCCLRGSLSDFFQMMDTDCNGGLDEHEMRRAFK